MRVLCLFSVFCFFLVSCGSDPLARPFVVEEGRKKPVRKEPKTEGKAFAGKVSFYNLSRDELASFRIIPERGNQLTIPRNETYDQVDGLWWQKETSGEWFKIPDHSEAWIGKAPKQFDGTAQRKDLLIYYRSNPLVHFVGRTANRVTRPAWVRDAGATKCPIPSPWVD